MTPRPCGACGESRSTPIPGTRGGDYVKCAACGSERQVNATPATFLRAQAIYYGAESVRPSSLANALQATMARRYVRLVARHMRGGRLLEVGPGAGHFVLAARAAGYDVHAVEQSAALAEQLRQTCGISVLNEMFETQVFDAATYDAYASFHVIEHVPDVDLHLRKASRLVRPGGYAFLATPNATGWEHRLLGRHSFNYSAGHIHVLTPTGMHALLRRSGWMLLETYTVASPLTLARGASSAVRALSGRGGSRDEAPQGLGHRVPPALGRPALTVIGAVSAPCRALQEWFGAGNELLVVARRT